MDTSSRLVSSASLTHVLQLHRQFLLERARIDEMMARAMELSTTIERLESATETLGETVAMRDIALLECDRLNVTVTGEAKPSAYIRLCLKALRTCQQKQQAAVAAAETSLADRFVQLLAGVAHERIRAMHANPLSDESVYLGDLYDFDPEMNERIHDEFMRLDLYDRDPITAMAMDAQRAGAHSVQVTNGISGAEVGKERQSN
jgi:hypothetical protein